MSSTSSLPAENEDNNISMDGIDDKRSEDAVSIEDMELENSEEIGSHDERLTKLTAMKMRIWRQIRMKIL